MKNKIDWLYDDEEEDDGTFDLVGKFKGKYVDVVSSVDRKWSVLYNNVRIKVGFESRDMAKNWAESVDLIDCLSQSFS